MKAWDIHNLKTLVRREAADPLYFALLKAASRALDRGTTVAEMRRWLPLVMILESAKRGGSLREISRRIGLHKNLWRYKAGTGQ